MYMHINAHTFMWLSAHLVKLCTLIIGAAVYVYELCIDLQGIWLYGFIQSHLSVRSCS